LIATEAKNFDCADKPFMSLLLRSEALLATTVAMEKDFNDSETDNVPIAEDLLPVKGKASGDRLPTPLISIRPTAVDRASRRGAIVASEDENIDACNPYGVEAM
jgi:hypothetical protein